MKNPSVFDKKNKFSKFEKENWFIGRFLKKSVNFPNKLFGFSKTRFRLNQIKTNDEVVKVAPLPNLTPSGGLLCHGGYYVTLGSVGGVVATMGRQDEEGMGTREGGGNRARN
jgi:hypothetical protein